MNLMLMDEWTTSPSQADGISEAEERRRLLELHTYVIEITRNIVRDQCIAATAMVLVHKLLKNHSLRTYTVQLPQSLLTVAAAAVFLAAKTRDMPITLATAARAYFSLELKLQQPYTCNVAAGVRSVGEMVGKSGYQLTEQSYTTKRENHYKEQIEAVEHKILEAIAFDFEALDNLPYCTLRTFIEKYANFACRENLYQVAFSFCNDSFKLPLCLQYHEKVVAAACVYQAMQYRKRCGSEPGIEMKISGYPWYKWIDSALESGEITQVVTRMSALYVMQPSAQVTPPTSTPTPVARTAVTPQSQQHGPPVQINFEQQKCLPQDP